MAALKSLVIYVCLVSVVDNSSQVWCDSSDTSSGIQDSRPASECTTRSHHQLVSSRSHGVVSHYFANQFIAIS